MIMIQGKVDEMVLIILALATVVPTIFLAVYWRLISSVKMKPKLTIFVYLYGSGSLVLLYQDPFKSDAVLSAAMLCVALTSNVIAVTIIAFRRANIEDKEELLFPKLPRYLRP